MAGTGSAMTEPLKTLTGRQLMLAVVNTPNGAAPAEVREVPEPTLAPNEALVEVRAFSLNRGELRLMQTRPEGLAAGAGHRRGRAAGRGRRHRPAGRHPRCRPDRQCRLGAARRGAGSSHGGAPRQCRLRAGGGVAGRRADGDSHLAPRRAVAGKAGAGDRCRGRRRPYGGADRRAIGGACHRDRRLGRARSTPSRRRDGRRWHRQGGGAVRADPRSRGRRHRSPRRLRGSSQKGRS